MRKGSIAIEHLVALFLGILVLAIIVYVIYKYVMGSSLSCEACRAEFTSWCSKCYLTNHLETPWGDPGTPMSTELDECITKCSLSDPPGTNCKGAQDACKTVGIPL